MVSRRAFLKTSLVATGAIVGSVLLGGCGQGEQQPKETAEPTQGGDSAQSGAGSTPADAMTPAGATAVVVFSRAGENYNVGIVECGNTAVLADMIAERVEADVVEIKTVQSYPESYDECTEFAKQEQADNARPELAGSIDLSGVDTVYLGYPIWWGDLPMPVYTFIESQDWQGKVVRPFSTNEGSGISGTDYTLSDKLAGADVQEALSMRGTIAQNERDEAQSRVDKWLEAFGA